MSTATFPPLDFADPAGHLARARADGIVIFGCGNFARDLLGAAQASGFRVHGFIVSAGAPAEHAGLPVLPLGQEPAAWRTLPLWIGVFNHLPSANYAAIRSTCESAGFTCPVLPQAYFEAVSAAMGWRYWLTERPNYARHQKALETAFAQLHDETSRRLLADTLRFRLGEIATIPGTPVDETHYFPEFLAGTREGPFSLVDAGAYDGDTLAQALTELPLREAWAFEPDPVNYERLAARARGLPIPTVCFPCGVSSSTATVAFSSGHGEASAIGGDGDMHIQVVRLDDCLPNARVDYLKFDVEGHEVEALKGATELVRRNRPILAIAGYHRWDDLWRIPAWIASLGLDYRLSFRIHTHNSFEAVFYAY